MPKYVIPVLWMVADIVTVEAEDLKSAIKIVAEGPLPDGEYVDDSFQVDAAGIPENNEDESIREEYKHLFDDDFRDI